MKKSISEQRFFIYRFLIQILGSLMVISFFVALAITGVVYELEFLVIGSIFLGIYISPMVIFGIWTRGHTIDDKLKIFYEVFEDI